MLFLFVAIWFCETDLFSQKLSSDIDIYCNVLEFYPTKKKNVHPFGSRPIRYTYKH